MANDYYDNADPAQRFQPATTVRADEVDGKFDQVSTGFDGVQADTDRSLKFPQEEGVSQEFTATPLQRRRKVLGFDDDGKLVLSGGFNYRGDWAADTQYLRNDVIRNPADANLYVATTDFVSGSTFSTANFSLAINVANVEAAKTEAKHWANYPVDTLVPEGDGQDDYSALHQATKASGSASAAATSKSGADASRDKAQKWAEEAEDTEVEAGSYSALHHSAKSSASADNSAASASASSNSADSASASESAAAASEALADLWANEAEDVEIEPGRFSAYHYAQKAAAFGDPNQFDITADQTADTRTSAEWMAALLTNQGNFSAVTANAFVKDDGSQPAWTAPTASTLETATALALVVGSTVVEIASGTSVTLPTLAAGTDYTIYASDAGALQAVDADSAAPVGERVVGGFHASAGASEIVNRSLWDLNWRPTANPRSMVLSLDDRLWADIYLADVDYALNGYSRNGQQIADDLSLPKIPAEYGGDGTATYTSASWWSFNDILSSAGKRFPHYQEFTALAYGVVERQAVGTDPGTTQHQAGHRSACGVEQATGVMWQWGADITGYRSSGSWKDWADGRGDILADWVRSPVFGASWDSGSNAGSRSSVWNYQPDNSYSNIGARGVCDHMNLQAER